VKKVIVAEHIANEAIEKLKQVFDVDLCIGMPRKELLSVIKDYDGIIIRSETMIDAELMSVAPKLKMVGRAGNGTDNIDVPEATKRGIIVANTPESNTMSAAEHTIALMLTQSRNIPQANSYLHEGKWERSIFKGNELYKKTLGIVGLGRIGSLIAQRMKAFGMNVIAFDPYISDDRFKRFHVEKKEKLEDLIMESDFITVHTPKTKETYHMINESHLSIMKDGVRLTNVARGGIIQESAILEGIKSGKIASAGIDVHEIEPRYENPLYDYDNVIVTPHLGASTAEAQLNVGMTVANQVIAGLHGEIVPNAINLPTMHRDELDAVKPYIELAENFGKMYYQLYTSPIETVKLEYFGELSEQETGMISIACVKGLLEIVISERINYINAMLIAGQLGILIEEKKRSEYVEGYVSYFRVTIKNSEGTITFGGNLSSKGEGRLVEINGYEMDITPGESMLIIRNMDVPGVVGTVGTVLGEERINVATMQLGRKEAGEKAMMVLNIDGEISEKVLKRLEDSANVLSAKAVKL